MNSINTIKLHELLIEALGDDLVYSVIYDEGKYYLAISVHKSERVEYSHGRNIQSCFINEKDFGKTIKVLAKQIIPMYEKVLVKKKNKDEV